MVPAMNSSIVFFAILIFALASAHSPSSPNNRTAKWFLGWGVGLVRFENSVCSGADGFDGTCYTRRQCNEIGGVATGTCASRLGVCCIKQITCGGVSSLNNTYFTSPNFPMTFNGGSTCIVTIQRCNPDICQIRIDFLAFSLAQPNDTGNCVNDALYVIGGASNVPVLCGENSGQHIYVDFNGDNDIQLIINTNAAITASRAWNFKITQIGCDCPTKAPTGCLQYYTALSGTVMSFNYGTTGVQNGTRQLANENYGVCVEMQPGYCSITWSMSSGDMYGFTVTGDTNMAVGNGAVGTPAAALNDGNCTTDFVVIPNPVYVNTSLTGPNTDRFCGNGFNSVTTSSKPFVMTVVTDGSDTPPVDVANRGFSLMYMQNQCSGAVLGK